MIRKIIIQVSLIFNRICYFFIFGLNIRDAR